MSTLSDATVQPLLEAGVIVLLDTHRPGCDRRSWRRHIVRSGAPWPIDRVIEWANTGKGGHEQDGTPVELFVAEAADRGCARWGLCDVPSDEGALSRWIEELQQPEAPEPEAPEKAEARKEGVDL